MADQVLRTREEPPARGNAGSQPALHGVGQHIVLRTDLLIERDQLLREAFRYAGAEILLREPLCAIRTILHPDIDGEVWESRIDVDGHVGEQQVILRLGDITASVIDLDLASALERRLADMPDLAAEPAVCCQIIVFRQHVDGGAEARMGDGAMVAFQVVLQHRLPVRMRLPVLARIELQRCKVDPTSRDDVEYASKLRLQRFGIVVGIDENPGTKRFRPKRQQRIVLQVETGFRRRARSPFEAAGKVIGPSVVAAFHNLRIAAPLHDLVAPVPADIDESGQARLIADHHDRDFAYIAGDVIADRSEFTERPDIAPGLAE